MATVIGIMHGSVCIDEICVIMTHIQTEKCIKILLRDFDCRKPLINVEVDRNAKLDDWGWRIPRRSTEAYDNIWYVRHGVDDDIFTLTINYFPHLDTGNMTRYIYIKPGEEKILPFLLAFIDSLDKGVT